MIFDLNIDTRKMFIIPNHKKTPHHTTTHYVCDRYQEEAPVSKPQNNGVKPKIQRKILKANNTAEIIVAPIVVPVTNTDTKSNKTFAMPKSAYRKLRKVKKKTALADYFEKHKPVSQEQLEWIDSVVRELDKADQEKIEKQQTAALYFAIDLKPNAEEIMDWGKDIEWEDEYTESYRTYLKEQDKRFANWAKAANKTFNYDIVDDVDINKYLVEFDAKEAVQKEAQTRKQINEFIKDRFVRKYGNTCTREKMHALDKTRDFRNAKLARMFKDLQITK